MALQKIRRARLFVTAAIGEKRNRVRIDRQVSVPDGHGGHLVTYTPRDTVWAHERPLSGRESLQAAQVTAVLTSVWEIWWRDRNAVPPDISVKDRLVIGSRTLEIESLLDPDDTRNELYLMCSEVQA